MDEWLLNALKSISVHWDGISCGVFFGFSTVRLRLKMIEHYVARRNVTNSSLARPNHNSTECVFSLVCRLRVFDFNTVFLVVSLLPLLSQTYLSRPSKCAEKLYTLSNLQMKRKIKPTEPLEKKVNKSNQLVKLVR